jgi:hypothetical protein
LRCCCAPHVSWRCSWLARRLSWLLGHT